LISAKSFWSVPLDSSDFSSVLSVDFSDFSVLSVFVDLVSARVAFFFFSSASLAAFF
jgi:hypothetical protein